MTERLSIAVVGAHLSGMPLNGQLIDRGGELAFAGRTAPVYRLFALPTSPPKPGMLRVADGGAAIDLEVWSLPPAGFGTFVAALPAPMTIGRVQLADGAEVPGFLVEPYAVDGAPDITGFGGWRAYLAR
ncbi:hypothetical protein [Actinoplanes sp. NBRC 101535]|uniref:allophanate hydrolase-related protein n=1 Tax=Actinoplanes sp. NBRC 101535 TaxID=3032196 RepID=UPI0024A0BDE7|nr:hypothetical protein [Actinoplanes sp. NBRC 101535]GLY03129.1 hypothetical protein Acsp01_35080 [Actinoplanes sp. NBRC 101535]